ncbi:hypothetical protein LguiB_022507 [Lonicera macranthoides]
MKGLGDSAGSLLAELEKILNVLINLANGGGFSSVFLHFHFFLSFSLVARITY